MYRIILNVARDSVRRRPQKPVSLDGHEPLEPSQPGDDLCRREAVRLVTLALADLPRPLREVLVLRHYEGLAFEEMTRLTGIPASTLKSRFAAALNRLRVRLQKLGYDPKDDTP
jgi:RNA polymerase sigma-70 factor (ECF subfamily)